MTPPKTVRVDECVSGVGLLCYSRTKWNIMDMAVTGQAVMVTLSLAYHLS